MRLSRKRLCKRVFDILAPSIGTMSAQRIADNKTFMTTLKEDLYCCPNYVETRSYTDEDIVWAIGCIIDRAFKDYESYNYDWL